MFSYLYVVVEELVVFAVLIGHDIIKFVFVTDDKANTISSGKVVTLIVGIWAKFWLSIFGEVTITVAITVTVYEVFPVKPENVAEVAVVELGVIILLLSL